MRREANLRCRAPALDGGVQRGARRPRRACEATRRLNRDVDAARSSFVKQSAIASSAARSPPGSLGLNLLFAQRARTMSPLADAVGSRSMRAISLSARP